MSEGRKIPYSFSDAELKQLALLLRQYGETPAELIMLQTFAERYIREVMTLEEAGRFFLTD